ncbi:MAG: hypothetical protein IMF19_12365 [Proteobacteria bacterium]|nr:hypothetical protein [Pseudomonadota bacterium]
MSLYLCPLRRFRFIDSPPDKSARPLHLRLEILFAPEDQFGILCVERTLIPGGKRVLSLWNANEGKTSIETSELIEKIYDQINLSDGDKILFEGNKLILDHTGDSVQSCLEAANSLSQIIPALLSLHLQTYVWIKEARGELNGRKFRCQLTTAYCPVHTSTANDQKERIRGAIKFWTNIDEDKIRFINACFYFSHALRLSQIQPIKETFVAEVILNLTKCLEILFSDVRDNVRTECKKLGFSTDFIEKRIIPIFLLRSKLDVAHVTSFPIEYEDRNNVLRFVNSAFYFVHKVLQKTEDELLSGNFKLPKRGRTDKKRTDILSAIAEYVKGPPPKN